MKKKFITIQDLRKRIYLKAKAEPDWRFWGIYTHICKLETLRAAYEASKKKKGAPGEDGVTFDQIEAQGREEYLKSIQEELVKREYLPRRNRKKKIPKGGGKYREISIPTIRDRVVQGAVKLILEAIFEADFQMGSYGSRPKKRAQDAVMEIEGGIIKCHTRVIDLDLENYYDEIKHHILLKKLGSRIADDEVMHLLKLILKTNGKKGIPQGGPLSPLLANLYLNEIDKMLEKAKEVTKTGKYTHLTYARYMDDLIICVDNYKKWNWLYEGVKKRLREEVEKLGLKVNESKSREVELTLRGKESFKFLGFEYRRGKTLKGKDGVLYSPSQSSRTSLLIKLKQKVKIYRGRSIIELIEEVNPILRGWLNYFRIGTSSKCFKYIKRWIERKIRRHQMRQKKRKGFGWSRWSNEYIHDKLGLYNDYKIRRHEVNIKAS